MFSLYLIPTIDQKLPPARELIDISNIKFQEQLIYINSILQALS